jgi:hypothetical protein
VSGTIRDPSEARRILEVIRSTTGATVIDNLTTPAARQILLHVRFAEVSRTALTRLSSDLFVRNPQDLGDAFDDPESLEIETLAEGIVSMFLSGANGAQLEAVIRALKTNGHFRSLAEPNLIALEGQEATFLAGGEFPFPVVQQGGGAHRERITIQWKEFGVRLNFTPYVTNIGTIRLTVAPEVSSLDFANGLTFGGFQIPAFSRGARRRPSRCGPASTSPSRDCSTTRHSRSGRRSRSSATCRSRRAVPLALGAGPQHGAAGHRDAAPRRAARCRAGRADGRGRDVGPHALHARHDTGSARGRAHRSARPAVRQLTAAQSTTRSCDAPGCDSADRRSLG